MARGIATDNTNPCLIMQTGSVEGFAGVGQMAIVFFQNLVKAYRR